MNPICHLLTLATSRVNAYTHSQNFVTTHLAPNTIHQATLPSLLRHIWPEVFATDSAARKACRRSVVLVDGAVGRCGTAVPAGATVELVAKTTRPPQPGEGRRGQPPAVPLRVVHEADEWAVVYKPAGMPVSKGQTGAVSVRQMLATGLAPSEFGAEPLWRPQFVHRLDAPTSGLLVVAKTMPALRALSAAFRERKVRKTYRAVVAGDAEASRDDRSELDEAALRLEWADAPGGLNCVAQPLSGKEARTEWRLLSRHESARYGALSMVELHPHTGRTHQLRRHMAALGHPIIGDARYWSTGTKGRSRTVGYIGGATRGECWPEERRVGLMLSAVALELPDPTTDEVLSVSVEQPGSFDDYCAGTFDYSRSSVGAEVEEASEKDAV